MKVNPTAIRRLAKLIVKNHPIPTNEVARDGKRVYLVHVNDIQTTHWHYNKGYKKIQAGLKTRPPSRFNWMRDERLLTVNRIRRAIRAKRKIEPIYLDYASPTAAHGKPFEALDGHHRLTAHRAEGKKFIRAVFHDYPHY